MADLPWDTVGIMLDFCPKSLYPMFRVNRSITRLVDRRVTALTFSKGDITEQIFFAIAKKYAKTITQFNINSHLKQVKKASFDKIEVRPNKLICLNLVGFNNVGEVALSRLIDSSCNTLESFKISYRSLGMTTQACCRLARCPNLK